MNDLISRQVIIDWASKIPIHDLSDGKGFCRVIFADDFLKALKTISPVQQWIPCSVRPPEEKDGKVLITLDGEVTTAIYSEFSNTWYIEDMCGVSNRVPTAWMPRPKPYEP